MSWSWAKEHLTWPLGYIIWKRKKKLTKKENPHRGDASDNNNPEWQVGFCSRQAEQTDPNQSDAQGSGLGAAADGSWG